MRKQRNMNRQQQLAQLRDVKQTSNLTPKQANLMMEWQDASIRKQEQSYANYRIAFEQLKYSVMTFKLLKTQDALNLVAKADAEFVESAAMHESAMTQTLKQFLNPEYLNTFRQVVGSIHEGMLQLQNSPELIDQYIKVFTTTQLEKDFIAAADNSRKRNRGPAVETVAAINRVDELIEQGETITGACEQTANETGLSFESLWKAYYRIHPKT